MSDVWARFTEFAAQRDGVVSLAESRAAGFDDRLVESWAENGRLARPEPQVFRVLGSSDTWRQRVRVAVATEGPLAVASRQTAAVLHGLKGFRPGVIHVTAPRWKRRKRKRIVVHESRVIDECDVVVIDGIRVTSLIRTLIDLAASVPPFRVGVAMDEAVRTERTTYAAVRLRTEELAAKGRRGIGVMRRLLDARPGGRCLDKSELERRFCRLLTRAGLPLPEQNVRVVVAGQVYEIDLAWRVALVGIEVQSEEHHFDLHHFHYDPEKITRLQAIGGWTILPVTSERLKRPTSLMREVAAALHRAGIDVPASLRPYIAGSETPEEQGC